VTAGRTVPATCFGWLGDLPGSLLSNIGRAASTLAKARRVQLRPPGIGDIAVLVLALAAIATAMFFLDSMASDWAWGLPRWFRAAFEFITNFGLGGWFLFPLAFLLLSLSIFATRPLSRMAQGVLGALAVRFGYLFLAIGVPGLFVSIVKRLIGRARPYVGGHDDPFAYVPFAWRPEYASMPSGHATTAAAAAVAIGAVCPRARPVMWLYALIIMFSRIIVLAHHPSDVIAGALVGGAGALPVRRWFAARRLLFSVELKAFPWPAWRRIAGTGRELAAVWLRHGTAQRHCR